MWNWDEVTWRVPVQWESLSAALCPFSVMQLVGCTASMGQSGGVLCVKGAGELGGVRWSIQMARQA